MRRLIEHPRFALLELVCAALSAGLIVTQPALGGWPLALMALPWGARLLARRAPLAFTGLEFWLLLFLVTAGIGVWASYSPAAAWSKFWILVSAVIVLGALAVQPRANLWLVAAALCGLGVLLVVYFLLVADLSAIVPDFGFARDLSAAWQVARPQTGSLRLNQNAFAGMFVILFPFYVAVGVRAWRNRRWLHLAWTVGVGLVLLLGLALTSSRAAWVALAGGLSLWAVWYFGGKTLRRPRVQRVLVASVLTLLLAAPVLAVWVVNQPEIRAWLRQIPLFDGGRVRLDLARQAVELAADYPLTGGGLMAFSGLYSRYVLGISDFYLNYAHNFLVDVALEQGFLGLLALIVVYGISLFRLLRPPHTGQPPDSDINSLRWAVLVGFINLGLHSLIDDPLYGEYGTSLLFLLPGLALALRPQLLRVGGWLKPQAAAVGILAAGLGLAGCLPSAQAVFWANLGAVEMARVELAGFPDVRWTDRNTVADLHEAQALLQQARRLDPSNRTAAHRLGLIAFQDGDYEQAIAALTLAAGDRATASRRYSKPLGYSYAWTGNRAHAEELLLHISEARYELQTYNWWWGSQGRPDLADYAAQLESQLARRGAQVISDPLALP
jgi:O-antigen ligase